MRNGGDVFILGNNSFPNSINSSTGWPDYYGDYISEEDMMDWFFDVSPMVLSDHMGLSIVNSDCSNDPIYNNVHTYPGCGIGNESDCAGDIIEPYWYNLSEQDLKTYLSSAGFSTTDPTALAIALG